MHFCMWLQGLPFERLVFQQFAGLLLVCCVRAASCKVSSLAHCIRRTAMLSQWALACVTIVLSPCTVSLVRPLVGSTGVPQCRLHTAMHYASLVLPPCSTVQDLAALQQPIMCRPSRPASCDGDDPHRQQCWGLSGCNFCRHTLSDLPNPF
jgi:hypothetical protein